MQVKNYNLTLFLVYIGVLIITTTYNVIHSKDTLILSSLEQTRISKKNFNTKSAVQNNLVSYKELKVACTNTNDCIAYVFIESKYFNKSNMKKIGEELSERFKDKSTISAQLFDNMELAKAYISGSKGLQDLQFDRRGRYFRNETEEFIIFYKSPTRKGKFTVVNFRKKP